ncbi:hypothetical protein DFH08DRAFT_1030706 [Mycena albidolilacea]|uniref:Uncharacterized protein n=1 Tax=Mycena albidolilacea TaxID=1033008 RepID=A0AAD6ZH89_9AGAR|nr:hypothetical protein DFH08DRAFT_1030706 [Mycena albidolilacea]
MPRLSKPRMTDEESYDLALAEADEERLTLLTKPLEGTFHFSLPAEIVPGAELPSHGACFPSYYITKEFVRWLGVTLRGRLERFVVKKTIEGYIFKFFGLWRNYAFLPVPKVYRNHVMSYFYSEEFDETSKLSTKSRVKEVANIVDVEILVKGILEDKKYFRTHRARWDTNYTIILSALSSERPGAMIESSCYRHSNESMTWDDHEFWVIPNPQDPHRPLFCCVVRVRLLKGHREDDSFMKYFFLLPEPASHRHVDALMYLLVNAFKDAIFVDVETPEQVFFPKNPCHTAHKLRIKESAKSQAVTRKEVYQDGCWTTSDTLAMPYFMITAFLRKISLFLRFVIWFTFYCFRRFLHVVSYISIVSILITIYVQESYQSRLAAIDLGAILSERHEANEENTNMMKAVCGMSKGRDPNAPISLDAAEVNELLDDPELVEFRRAKGKLRAQVNAEITKRASIDKDDDVAVAAQNEVINALRMNIRTIDREHRAIKNYLKTVGALVTRETYALVALKRKKYFDEASFRVLNNIQPEQRVPLATKRNIVTAALPPVTTVRPGQENTAPGAPAPARRARVSRPTAPDPLAEALEILYNFTPDDVGSAHFVASVNALLGLPERPFKHCYPGESPTHDDKCPVCGIDCTPRETNKGGGTVATHIHKCIMRQLQATVQQQVEAQYEPTTCLWTTCRDETVFATRTEFCAHIIRHMENLRFASARGLPGAQCMWKTDDEPCGERNHNF